MKRTLWIKKAAALTVILCMVLGMSNMSVFAAGTEEGVTPLASEDEWEGWSAVLRTGYTRGSHIQSCLSGKGTSILVYSDINYASSENLYAYSAQKVIPNEFKLYSLVCLREGYGFQLSLAKSADTSSQIDRKSSDAVVNAQKREPDIPFYSALEPPVEDEKSWEYLMQKTASEDPSSSPCDAEFWQKTEIGSTGDDGSVYGAAFITHTTLIPVYVKFDFDGGTAAAGGQRDTAYNEAIGSKLSAAGITHREGCGTFYHKNVYVDYNGKTAEEAYAYDPYSGSYMYEGAGDFPYRISYPSLSKDDSKLVGWEIQYAGKTERKAATETSLDVDSAFWKKITDEQIPSGKTPAPAVTIKALWEDIENPPDPPEADGGSSSGSSSGSGGSHRKPAKSAVKEEPKENPKGLDTVNHYAYIIGYLDGGVHPEAKITRAETATIFFRLLKDEVRDQYWSAANPYTDVNAGDWYNNAVSTLSNMGIINGYPDGAFGPDNYIARAEFAKIAVGFFENGGTPYDSGFTDISEHWAADCISRSAERGIVNGYPDGTFRPDDGISRAEAMAMVNRVLGRMPHADGMHEDMILWQDNMDKNAWYYADVQEATNSHDYKRGLFADGKEYEQWTDKLYVRDWAELEMLWGRNH